MELGKQALWEGLWADGHGLCHGENCSRPSQRVGVLGTASGNSTLGTFLGLKLLPAAKYKSCLCHGWKPQVELFWLLQVHVGCVCTHTCTHGCV